MSHLIAIIDEYKDARGGPSDSSIARAIGVAPQTISSWRRRGIHQLPDRETLKALAKLTQRDYEADVLPAVLKDIAYLPDDSDGGLSDDSRRVAGDDLIGLPNVAHTPRDKKGRRDN